MSLALRFAGGAVDGAGADCVGAFTLRGMYSVESGEVTWVKSYATHGVDYRGAAETQHGIWGLWRLASWHRGGFQIRPLGHATGESAGAEAEVETPAAEPVGAGAG